MKNVWDHDFSNLCNKGLQLVGKTSLFLLFGLSLISYWLLWVDDNNKQRQKLYYTIEIQKDPSICF